MAKKKAAPRKKTVSRKKPAAKRRSAIPAGYAGVTPHLVLDQCAQAIEFYKTAFGAKESLRMSGPGGKIAHAEIALAGSRVMMSDEMAPMPGQPGVYKSPKAAGFATGGLFLYLKDVDAAFDRAIQAGCTVRTPPTDMFWGDRFAQVIDPFGHTWGMGTRLYDLTPKQIAKRQQEFFAKMPTGPGA
jgi:PhnB protein